MLGIYFIICLAIFLFIKLISYNLLKGNHSESVEINSDGRTYNVCYRAAVLLIISYIVILMGYLGCVWPYWFIEWNDRVSYLMYIVMFGFAPILVVFYICYLIIRSAHGSIRISTDEIEYNMHKSFSVKVSDIKKITYSGLCSFQIHLKEKRVIPLLVNLNIFYKKREICSLMKQLRDYTAKLSGKDKSFAHKYIYRSIDIIVGKYFFSFFFIIICLSLLYTSYCCIDYDFFIKDYTACYNALGVDPNQPENAWPYYVQAAVNYKELEDDFQEIINNSLKSGQLDLTEDQADKLQKWFNENASSWASLKKAVSINYCNATYKNISLVTSPDRDDFSSPSDIGYLQIRRLYNNCNACRLAGLIELGWFNLFQMQLTSSKHFINGKSLIDQLVGYSTLGKSVKLLGEQESYELGDLQKARTLLKEYFPVGLPSLNIEGEILMFCNSYEDMFTIKKFPIQTPLNPMYLSCGSISGTEAYIRKQYKLALEQAQKGIEVKPKSFSIMNFPILRHIIFGVFYADIFHVYKVSQRANTNLLAAYVILDLEEYWIMKGSYPVDISQLGESGLTSELPDDTDSGGKIIYRNDGKRAILYAVGPNAKDDGGHDDECSDEKRDDIIYWQKNVQEKVEQ